MSERNPESVKILGFVTNLLFTTRIESVVESVGYQVQWVNSPYEWENPPFNEIIQLSPVLILVDLGIEEIPWKSWIQQLKDNPATKSIPLVCFGSHKDIDTLKTARQAGADRVVSRSLFFSSLKDVIQKYSAG